MLFTANRIKTIPKGDITVIVGTGTDIIEVTKICNHVGALLAEIDVHV